MKLLRFNLKSEDRTMARLGVLLKGDRVADLRAVAERYLAEVEGDSQAGELAGLRIPADMVRFIAIGRPARALAESAMDWWRDRPDTDALRTRDAKPLVAPLAEVRLHAPVRRPGKVIAVGRNYGEHLSEMGTALPGAVPASWIKATSAIVGPVRQIVKPAMVRQLDYETELAVVIGRTCKDVPEARALQVVAGYTIMCDITARDIVRIERKEGHQLLGKMFDSFAPQGPWLVTADEIADPQNLAIRSRVNGEIRQDGSTAQMIFPIARLIAYLSQMTLDAGDVILTGTPSGVAMGRKPDPTPYFLDVGDVLEAEIEGIGSMRLPVVAEPEKERSWDWTPAMAQAAAAKA